MAKSEERNPKSGKSAATEPVKVNETAAAERPVRRTFPGPRGAKTRLRVAIDRGAYAELVAHAKGSLDAEVCGVLAGQICEDDEGLFVHVEAVVRGTAASQASTHVTFTQATWNAIYQVLERDHPKLKITGWYHTHPGFGVEFSEMDLFIQRNFFAGPSHIALVTDPLSGDVAICSNTPQGIEYLNAFWVDGREQQCRVPARAAGATAKTPAGEAPAASGVEPSSALEARVGQLLESVDEMRHVYHRFMLTCGILFCMGIVVSVGYFIYSQWAYRVEPPKVNQIVPVPIQVGDKTVILGVGITSWEVPAELNAILLQAELLRREAAEKAAKEEAEKLAKTNSAAVSGTNPPAPAKP